MKIHILLNQSYPNGFALTKRFHLYAKGFVNTGHSAKIIVPFPTEKEGGSSNTLITGVFENVPFRYSWNNTTRSNHFLIRRYHDFFGSIKAGFIVLREHPDVIITSSFSIYFYLYLKLISIFFPFKLIKEKNEVDFMSEDKVSYLKRQKVRFYNNVFNGFIVINEQLSNYLKSELKIKVENVVVPILVEDSKENKALKVQKTIVYTGTYQERKDGILTILNAFAIIKDKYPDYTLVLTGSPKRSLEYNKIVDIIESKELFHQVKFTGYLSKEALRDVLKSANMLILAKPNNRQNIYNFPTKVGEYLLSGRPVITTKIGVLGELLMDYKNVIFSEYGIENISKKIEFIIRNPEIATSVGSNGREFALENFNYLKYADKMVDYFKLLN